MPGPPGEGPERFLLPCYTEAAESVVARCGLHIPDQPALPNLDDPEYPPVIHPSGDPLVPLEHRRIRVLSNYWHAGWDAALPTTWLRAEALDRLSHADRKSTRLNSSHT